MDRILQLHFEVEELKNAVQNQKMNKRFKKKASSEKRQRKAWNYALAAFTLESWHQTEKTWRIV